MKPMAYPITPEEIKATRLHFKKTQEDFARTMGLGYRVIDGQKVECQRPDTTVSRWEAGKSIPGRAVRRKVWKLANSLRLHRGQELLPERGIALGWDERKIEAR